MIKHYINLTNGIEALEKVKSFKEPYSFIRIQSTTLEGNNYLKLMQDLDHDFLLNLVLGVEVKVYDFGTNRKLSKTIYKGIPLIRYILNRFWLGLEKDCYFLGRNNTHPMLVNDHVNNIYERLFIFDNNREKSILKNKLGYYKRFINCEEINLEGISESTKNDGNYGYYRELLVKNYGIKEN